MITPLHNHSEYSAIDGLSKIDEIADRMEQLGCPCCGLTDHGVVAGHLELDKVFRKRDIKPIFGCELYHGVRFGEKLGRKRDAAHLIALAMTNEGLRNLWRLNDAANCEEQFHHVGRCSWDNIEKYHEGIVFTSACPGGLVAKGIRDGNYDDLNRYLDIIGDDFYIELTTYPGDELFFDSGMDEPILISDLNRAKYEIAQERGIPVVYGDDGHYALPEQFEAHDVYVAKSTGQSVWTPIDERKMYHPEGALCIKTEGDVRAALSYLPESAVDEAIANANAIGERADAHLPGVSRHLPVFIPNESPYVEEGKYADDEGELLFLDLVEQGMVERYGEYPSQKVIDQTFYEAEVFIESGLYHYFLLAWDVMQFADEQKIERGPGRGSSAGCIVAFELGITDIDPLPYDLIFERFWNPGRAEGFPDIDSDFEKGRRREIKDYLGRRWGDNRVRSIGTVGRMKPKGLVDAMAKVFSLTNEEHKTLKNLIDKIPDIDILGSDQIGWAEDAEPGKVIYVMHPSPSTDHDIGEQICDWVESLPDKRQRIVLSMLDMCETLCNRVASYGVHASGIVVSDVDLQDELPCRFAGSPEQRIPVTQFAMEDVDKRQFVKFDALGLRTLDVLADWKRLMLERHGVEIDWSQLEWKDNNPEMWKLPEEGFAAGIFQIEGGYPKKLAEQFKPESVSDLSIIVALNRPGPIRTGTPGKFIRRRAGDEETTYDHPFLEDVLDETYGLFLYQEQVIRFFNKMGYSQSESDVVRKILGKKQPEKWDALYHGKGEWEGKSYLSMSSACGIDRDSADVIWHNLEEFAKYSFNKAHSVAYGTITWRATYAKHNGDIEFYTSGMSNVEQPKRAKMIPPFINEAHRKNIIVHRPDIEYSGVSMEISEDGDIYFGFDDIKGVSTEAAEFLVALREEGIADLSSPESLDAHMTELSKEWSKINAQRKKAGKPPQEGKSPKQLLNSGHIEKLYTAGVWERVEGEETPLRDLQEREKEMINCILSDNSAQAFANNIDLLDDCDTYAEALAPYVEDEKFTLPGVITNIKEVRTKKGDRKMGIITIDYEGDELEFAVFPNQWKTHRFLWHERNPGIFTVKHAMNNNNGQTGYHFVEGQLLD